MIISCPNCQTQYNLPSESLGATGRSVRCSRCATTWHQPPLVETPPPAPPVLAPEPAVQSIETPAASATPDPWPEEPGETEAASTDHIGVVIDGRATPPLSRGPQRRSGRIALAAAALVCPLILLLGALYFFRDGLVTAWPATARLYHAVGLAVGTQPYPFQIRGVTTAKGTADGKPTLVVAGEVANASLDRQEVPRLRIVLRSADDRLLQSLDFSAEQTQLQPGEAARFQTTVLEPPPDATSAVVTLAVK